MLLVLKETPGVTYPKLGFSDKGGWHHPFLEYRASEKAVWTRPTRFDLLKPDESSHGKFVFQGGFPGLYAPTEKGPDVHVSSLVIENWKARCGVSALMLFN